MKECIQCRDNTLRFIRLISLFFIFHTMAAFPADSHVLYVIIPFTNILALHHG